MSSIGRHPLLIGSLVLLIGLLGACLPPTSRGPGAGGSAATAGVTEPTASVVPALPSGPTPRPSFVAPTPTPAPTFAAYTVRTGDTLISIARVFRTSARSIAYWNRVTYPSLDPDSAGYRPNRLEIGWRLFLIPGLILADDEAPPDPTEQPDPDASDEPAGD